MRAMLILLALLLAACFSSVTTVAADPVDTVHDRLWIWGHPAGAYNSSYLAAWPHKSSIEPVAAAQWLGISNIIFVCYDAQPAPPFDSLA